MKYFNPSYWFKLWVLSAPLFNSKSEGIYAKSIDNQNIKDWASKNTTNISLIKNQENITNQAYSLLNQSNQNYNLPIRQDCKAKNYLNKNLTIIEKDKVQPHNRPPDEPPFRLNVNPTKQGEKYWCGPAVAEAILRYFNIQSANNIEPVQESYPMQSTLAQRMTTNFFTGTNPTNWINTINSVFRENNVSRGYSFYQINGGGTWVRRRFYRLIRQSLENNMPFAIAYTGNIVNSANIADFNVDGPNDQHFVVITAVHTIQRNELEGIIDRWYNNHIYTVMDPWTREFREIDEYNLYLLFSAFETSYWIYDSGLSPMEWEPADDEAMDIEFGQANLIAAVAFCLLINNKSSKTIIENNSNNKNKICELKNYICENIKGNKINAISILNENTKGNLKAGDIYVGTDKGLYLINFTGNVYKEDNINDEEVTSIKKFNKDDFYATTKNGDVYFLRTDKVASHGHLVGEILPNVKSSDLNKEIKLYYNNDKAREQINFEPSNSEIRKKRIFTLNLGKINPVDNYKKIELLGDYYSDKWGTRVKWGSYIYDSNHITNKGKNYDIGTVMREGSNKLVDNIKNYKVNDDTTMWWIENHYAPLLIQSVSDTDFIAWVEGLQKFGFTFYWENENYYLQAITFQYLDWRASETSLECWMKIGNGIRLYNDDENIRTKREIFDKNNLEDKPNKRVISNELKNLTKWNDDFTKSINYEQHLPIDNKPNFSTNNITSL